LGLPDPGHPVQCPKEVDRCRPGGPQFLENRGQFRLEISPAGEDFLCPQDHTESSGYPNRRRAPDREAPDGGGYLPVFPANKVNLFFW
jgi:hypothetical protein